MEVVFFADLSELPMYNWDRLSKSGELKHLVKEGVYDNNLDEQARILFEDMQQEYLDLFGVNQDSEYLMTLYKRKISLMATYMIDGKRSLLNQINITQGEIDFILKQQIESGGVSLDEQLVSMGKFLGYGLKSKDTTVTEFKATLNVIEQWQSNQSKVNK